MIINLLVTSIGNKVPLVECIRDTMNYDVRIIGADANEFNIARHFCDFFWEMPLLTELKIEEIIHFCKENEINHILPTREIELEYFSMNLEKLSSSSIHVLTSSNAALKKTNDKYLFYETLVASNINVIPTFQSVVDDFEKYVVKERYGSGSKNLFINVTKNQAIKAAQSLEFPILQPYISGQEYSIDVYITQKKKILSTVVRKRTLVIDGESQITEIIDYPKLEELINRASIVLDLKGHIMFQAIEDRDGELWIVECNARIGGASTLSIYAGLDTFNWWIKETIGDEIHSPIEIKKLKQIRYKKDLII